MLVMGFFLLLFGANPDASFAEWVYRALDRAMKPFRDIFQSVDLSGNSVLLPARVLVSRMSNGLPWFLEERRNLC